MKAIRVMAFVALIGFALGIAIVGDALAGEKVKIRGVGYVTKFEPVNVGDAEGHIVAVFDAKGITTNLQRKSFFDGWLWAEQGLVDMNVKTDTFAIQGYDEYTDKEGNKIFFAHQGKGTVTGLREGTITITKGTGKYEGIRGNGTWVAHPSGMQWYSDAELDVELPR